MNIFLTGATGFIGQHLTLALLKRGWNVTALVRNPNTAQAHVLGGLAVRLAIGDVTNRESLRAAMPGADLVIHSAGHYEFGVDWAGRQLMNAINVAGTENVLGVAHELNVPRSVYVSSVVAFGESTPSPQDETFVRRTPCRTVYEQSKTDAHEIARRYQVEGLPLIIVCPNGVVGPNDHSSWGYFVRLYVNRVLPPIAWAPAAVQGCVYVDDLAEGIALAAEKGRTGETYLLSGEPQTMRQHLGLWCQRPGAFRPRVWLPAGLAARLFAPVEPLQRAVGLPAFISSETVRASATNLNFSSEKAMGELRWTHRSTQDMWCDTIDGEIRLLAARKSQNLVQRLRPLDVVDVLFRPKEHASAVRT